MNGYESNDISNTLKIILPNIYKIKKIKRDKALKNTFNKVFFFFDIKSFIQLVLTSYSKYPAYLSTFSKIYFKILQHNL